MDLKKLLKALKLNESIATTLLGALIIIVVGIIAINYFSSKNPEGEITEPSVIEETQDLPTTHVVQKGEDLWKIAEKYYHTGYNWTDIANANNLENPGVLTEGTELVIPVVTPILSSSEAPVSLPEEEMQEPTVTITSAVEEEEEPTLVPTLEPTEAPKPTPSMSEKPSENSIERNSYTVQKGDNLWNIAVRAYGDGFKWVEIAKENNLKNPDLIHPGNKFVLPR